MGVVASKLLMCVCAGSVGAAVVPVAKAVRHHRSPHVAARPVAARAPAPAAIAAVAAPCEPTVAGAALAALPFPDAAPGFDNVSGGPGFGESALFTGGGGSGVGGGGGGNPPPGLESPPPSTSAAPEPLTWALMVTGFGVIGGAMRYARVVRAA